MYWRNPLEYGQGASRPLPAVLINTYNIGNIFKVFLRILLIAESQIAVLEHRKEMQVY
ncbi:MAG: hypothetical protein LBK73_09160 [Treponema sp.]|jgi:hypothetical protein|nr:hypothetical protein [Treponema sp.]